jgi:hypothetical protein
VKSLHFFSLKRVIRQSDLVFSSILTKIGNGDMLMLDKTALLASWFKSRDSQ